MNALQIRIIRTDGGYTVGVESPAAGEASGAFEPPFASVALRNAWESGPLPWSENNDYPAESTPLPLTPIVKPTENDVVPH